MINHVTGIYNLGIPAKITNPNGITEKLYEAWLRAHNGESLLFINLQAKKSNDRRVIMVENRQFAKVVGKSLGKVQYDFSNDQRPEDENLEKFNTRKEYENVLGMCNELSSLDHTLKKIDSGYREALQKTVVNKLKSLNFDLRQLANWW